MPLTPRNRTCPMNYKKTGTISFADVAHQTLIFDPEIDSSRLILKLIDTPWVQRLRRVRQTGNTNLVYMNAEHSRFGHSVGVAYLASLLLNSLARYSPEHISKWGLAVAGAALLHDVGHIGPGSHLAERVWSCPGDNLLEAPRLGNHENVTQRILNNDPAFASICETFSPDLLEQICNILAKSPLVPQWTWQVVAGDGWNVDRGNWSILDSTMCSVSYGRYNVEALIDAYRISSDEQLVLAENRVDALTHFFVARDSMYRQIYQHRVSQGADALTGKLVLRLRHLAQNLTLDQLASSFNRQNIFADSPMLHSVVTSDPGQQLPLETVFEMTDAWWTYHVDRWCNCHDAILADLAKRQRDRILFKTVRIDDSLDNKEIATFVAHVENLSRQQGYDPRYYLALIANTDKHRSKLENPPLVLLDNNEPVPVTHIEPMLKQLFERPSFQRRWLALPKEVKDKLGMTR